MAATRFHRQPLRLIAAWLALAVLCSGTGVWLAQLLGPRHVHAGPVLQDVRRIVPGHAETVHHHADARSHHHAASAGAMMLGADESSPLLDAALAAAALLAPASHQALPVAVWRATLRRARPALFPASHDAEPDRPPPRTA